MNQMLKFILQVIANHETTGINSLDLESYLFEGWGVPPNTLQSSLITLVELGKITLVDQQACICVSREEVATLTGRA